MGHYLLQVSIDDFVILEQRPNPVEQSDAALGLWPHSCRTLDQLNIVDDFKEMSTPISRLIHLDSRGRVISGDNAFDIVAAK